MKIENLPSFNNRKAFNVRYLFTISLICSVVLTGLSTIAHTNRSWKLDDDFHFVFTLVANLLLIFFDFLFIFYILQKYKLSRTQKYIFTIGGTLILTIIFSLLSGVLHHLIYDNPDPNSNITITHDIIVATFAILITVMIHNLSSRLDMRIETEKLQNENLMIRYEALERQIDPHFLFNSLNTLSGLIGNDDDSAQHYLQRLAATYRYIMQSKRIVTLSDELQFVDSYCEMMTMRYGSTLRIVKDIDDTLLHHELIPMSIQLLVENALKHNVISERHPLSIRLETTDHATFRVSNTMQPKQDESDSSGLGLANLGKRYQLLCRQDIAISNSNNIFAVEIPLLDSATASQLSKKLNIT